MKRMKVYLLLVCLALGAVLIGSTQSSVRAAIPAEGEECLICLYDAVVYGSNPVPTGYNCYKLINHQPVYQGATTECYYLGGDYLCHYWACATDYCINCAEGNVN